MTTLLSDGKDFKSKPVTRQIEGLYPDKGVDSSRNNNYKHTRTKQSSKIYEPNINRTEGRNRQLTIMETSGDFSTPLSIIDRTSTMEWTYKSVTEGKLDISSICGN